MAGPTITLTIAGDARDARRAMRSVGDEANEMDNRLEKSAGSWDKWRGRAVAASTGVLTASVLAGKEIVSSAAEAEQSMGAVDSVFKNNAGTIKKWAEGAADSMGLSAHQYRELAATAGAQLKNMGVAQDELTSKTNTLIQTGADLAATFGGTTVDAVDALTSALRGEFDPLERYGISIKQSDINARLAAKGLDKLTGSARKNAEQQVITAMIAEQSADAQGQFAREADTAAGQQQRLAAQVENLKAKLGEQLLPVFTQVMTFITGTVIPWLQRNKDTIMNLGIAVSGLAAFILTANTALKAYNAVMVIVKGTTLAITAATKAWTLATKLLNLAMKASPMGLIITAIAGLIALIVDAAHEAGGFGKLWDKVTGAIARAAKWVADKVSGAFNWVKDKVIGAWNSVGNFFENLWDGIVGHLKDALNWIIGLLNEAIDGLNWLIRQANRLPGINIGEIGHIPTLHTGGVVPGAPGEEVVTLLQAGERVTRAGAGSPKTVKLVSDGTKFGDLVLETLRKTIRQQGGDVQLVLGR